MYVCVFGPHHYPVPAASHAFPDFAHVAGLLQRQVFPCSYVWIYGSAHTHTYICVCIYARTRAQNELYACMKYMYPTARNIPKIWLLIYPTARLQGPSGMPKRKAWEIRLESRIDPEDGKPGMFVYKNICSLVFVDQMGLDTLR